MAKDPFLIYWDPMRKTALGVVLLWTCSCTSTPPADPFAATPNPGWTPITLRQEMTPEDAWRETLKFFKDRFELEMSSKETGTLRTVWTYDWSGQEDRKYRVRATVRFYQSDSRVIHVLPEAQRQKPGGWTSGYDTVFGTMLLKELGAILGKKNT